MVMLTTNRSNCILLCLVLVITSCGHDTEWKVLATQTDGSALCNALIGIRSSPHAAAPSPADLEALKSLVGHEDNGVRYQAMRLLAKQPVLDKELFYAVAGDECSDCRIASVLGVFFAGWEPGDALRFARAAERWPADAALEHLAGIVMEQEPRAMAEIVVSWMSRAGLNHKAEVLLRCAMEYPWRQDIADVCSKGDGNEGIEVIKEAYRRRLDR